MTHYFKTKAQALKYALRVKKQGGYLDGKIRKSKTGSFRVQAAHPYEFKRGK